MRGYSTSIYVYIVSGLMWRQRDIKINHLKIRLLLCRNQNGKLQKYHTFQEYFQKCHPYISKIPHLHPGSRAYQSQGRLSGLRLRVEDLVAAPITATVVRLPLPT